MTDEWIHYDALSLGEMIQKGDLDPIELLEETIHRIERVNPELNAVIHPLYDQARHAAERRKAELGEKGRAPGPFHGVPFLLKDLLAEFKGSPFHEGSLALKGYVSGLDSELVRRQKASGLVFVGKTNTPEFGALPTTEPLLHGPARNPWDTTRTPGGSSGGSAAAVAAGIVPMAHGNDGGGSIRIPASCCGLFGLKPTRGRNPLGPLFGDAMGGLACEHALTRTVRDSAALLDATSGPDLGDPYWAPPNLRPFLEAVTGEAPDLKIGLLSSLPEGWVLDTALNPECEEAVEDAGRLCESLGHVVEPVDPEELAYPLLYKKFGDMWCCALGRVMAFWEAELGKEITRDQVEPMTWIAYQAGLKKTGADYLGAVEAVQDFSRQVARWYDQGGYDMILSPTMPLPPTKLGAFQPSPQDPMRGFRMSNAYAAFTYVYNLTGQPAMSVPLFWTQKGIPIGVQFAASFGEEAKLYALASQLEQARPWKDRKPPCHCGLRP